MWTELPPPTANGGKVPPLAEAAATPGQVPWPLSPLYTATGSRSDGDRSDNWTLRRQYEATVTR